MIEHIKRLDRALSYGGPGSYFDYSTKRGCVRGILFCIAATVFLWSLHDILYFLHYLLGEPREINRAKQSWHQTWALIIGLPGIFWSVFALIMLPINRRRAVESAKGQWFDQDGQTKRDALEPKSTSELDGTRVEVGDIDATITHKKP